MLGIEGFDSFGGIQFNTALKLGLGLFAYANRFGGIQFNTALKPSLSAICLHNSFGGIQFNTALKLICPTT